MTFFSTVISTERTNKPKNPSFEAATLTGTWTAQTGVTLTVSTDVSKALFGLQSCRFQTTTTNNTGMVGELDSACANAIHYIYIHVIGTQPTTWRAGLHNSTSGVPSAAATMSTHATLGSHTVYKLTVAASDANGMDKVWIGLPAAGSHTTDCYIDGVYVSTVDGTYFDGDSGFGHVWNGQRCAEGSTAYAWYDSQPVGGGVVNSLDNGSSVRLRAYTGAGVPPIKNLAQDSAQGYGALYQSTQISPRVVQLSVMLVGTISSDPQVVVESIHSLRETFLAKLPIGRPFELRYTRSSVTLSLMVVYEGGLAGQVQKGHIEEFTLALVAYDEPQWRLTYESRTALTMTLAQTFNYNLIRHAEAGNWEIINPNVFVYAYALGPDRVMWLGGEQGTYQLHKWTGGTSITGVAAVTGGSALVNCIAVSPDNARVYIGGNFTSAGGTAATNIAYLTLSTGAWSAMGSGCNGSVQAMKFDTDGNLWIGGLFTTANGTTVNGICKWNGSAFSAVQSGVSGSNQDVYCLDIAPNGDVYLGGDFTGASQCSTPSAPTVAGATTTGGTFVPTDQRYYQVTALTGTGETLPSTQGNDTLGVGENSFTLTLSAVTNATSYNIYRALTSGGTYYYIGNTTTTSFTDIGYADQAKTTALIASNTTGGRTTNVARYRPSDSAFYSVGTVGLTGGIVYCNAVGRDGVTCYWGGAFLRADEQDAYRTARYNGSVNLPMHTGMLGGDVRAILQDSDGSVVAGGAFTSASGRSAAANLARWVGGDEGGEWVHIDIGSWPGSTTVRAIALRYRDLWVGHNTTGSGVTAYRGTLTYDGYEGYPMLVIVGPSSSTMSVKYFEIVGAGRLFLDLTIRTSETVVIDLYAGTITSNYTSGTHGSEDRTRTILTGSTFSGLKLRNGTNSYVMLATGTLTGSSCTLVDRTAYLSSDT